MSYLILDTETTGLFDFTQAADAEGQPRMASCAMIIADDELQTRWVGYQMIKPEGWTMSPEAEAINGLSTELLQKWGLPIRLILDQYSAIIADGLTVACHNADFDTKVMRAELRRAGSPDLYEQTETICTMKELTAFCAIPKSSGFGLKWPRLAEACEIVLGRPHADAHGALPDAMVCLDLLRFMKQNGIGSMKKAA